MGISAPVCLGSTLLKSRFSTNKVPIQTGYAPIDNTLEGGFHHGEINSIAGESASDKTLVFELHEYTPVAEFPRLRSMRLLLCYLSMILKK